MRAAKVDYADPSSLEAALKGQDALIITMAVTAPPDSQDLIIEAAARAKVPWILPNEWGIDSDAPGLKKDIPMLFEKPNQARALIEKLGVSSWIGMCSGYWYEFSLGGTPLRFGFDFANKSLILFGDGNVPINVSTWAQTGRAVANLLSLKILPDDEHDESPTISRWRNRPLHISSFKVSQRDMFASVLRVTGDKESDWTVTSEPVEKRFVEARKELFETGDRRVFGKMIYARNFFDDGSGLFETRYGGLDNERLGLPVEDLDEATAVGISMSLTGDKY